MSEDSNIEERISPYGIGIDLGTTNSSASLFIAGKTIMIPLDGRESMPSAVRFNRDKAFEIAVGRSAKSALFSKPDEVFTSFKSLMKDDAWRNVEAAKEKYSSIKLSDVHGEAQDLTPTMLAAEVLKKIMYEANSIKDIDLKGNIQKVVICVPANSTNEYKENVFKAAILADIGYKGEDGSLKLDDSGHPVGVMLLEEPTAAAYQYGLELGFFSAEKQNIIMVYDFGGGTFDVTILKIDSGDGKIPEFRVLATQGVNELGGDDIDKEIMKMAAEHLKEVSGIDIFDMVSDQKATSKKQLKDAQQKIKDEAEKLKIAEFARTDPKLEQEGEINITNVLSDGDGNSYNLVCGIRKSVLLTKIEPMLDRTIECAIKAIEEARITVDDINRIILVGGSSKAEWVIKKVKDHFKKDPYNAPNVDLFVSQGAGFYASFAVPNPVSVRCSMCDASLAVRASKENPCPACGFEGVKPAPDYVNKHYGILTKGGLFGLVLPKGEVEVNSEKDDIILSAKRRFGVPDNADNVVINIYETQENLAIEEHNGEYTTKENCSVYDKKNGNNLFQYLGEFTLSGITPAPEGTIPIEVSIELDKNKTLRVKATAQGKTGETSLSVVKKD